MVSCCARKPVHLFFLLSAPAVGTCCAIMCMFCMVSQCEASGLTVLFWLMSCHYRKRAMHIAQHAQQPLNAHLALDQQKLTVYCLLCRVLTCYSDMPMPNISKPPCMPVCLHTFCNCTCCGQQADIACTEVALDLESETSVAFMFAMAAHLAQVSEELQLVAQQSMIMLFGCTCRH